MNPEPAQSFTLSRDELEDILDYLFELRGERQWSKDEIRCNYKERYDELSKLIDKLNQMLK